MVDLVCDEDLVPFYERFGMVRYGAMILRQREALGRPPIEWRPRQDSNLRPRD